MSRCASPELMSRVSEILGSTLSANGEAVIDAFNPAEHKIKALDQKGGGCFGFLRSPKSKLDNMRMRSEIYVVTSQAVYTVVDKAALAQLAEPQGFDVSRIEPFKRIAFMDMDTVWKKDNVAVKHLCIISRKSPSSSGPPPTLKWYLSEGTDSSTRILINKAFEDFMVGAAALSTLPKGALENRITSN
eukprot:CAMPEP_0171485086 /NCGR_PEP_ID=MMETSP0958-20121227/354_1 /TAXON_ID=87120 /ORGANISM="Aurantiochytrium limacinum, Strain ATCCMYA-1381" /LENGTH=187 /DNA_ID=CAMNT_0012017845 /DNA_START=229 /DNA_END=792 /DNA_ORIENTATION=+